MIRLTSAIVATIALLAAPGHTQVPAKASPPGRSPLAERVGDTGFIQIESPSFASLTDQQKAVAYWLTQASIAIQTARPFFLPLRRFSTSPRSARRGNPI